MKERINPMAFPVPSTEWDDRVEGMTLRDYFAGKVIAGLPLGNESTDKFYELAMAESFAKRAYRIADAMVKVRDQDGNN